MNESIDINHKIVETQEGRYLYSVINYGDKLCFGNIGINNHNVFTVPHEDIAAVVHSCKAEAYRTTDNEKAKEWILAHNYVIDYTTKQFGTVLPFAFDSVVAGSDISIRNWLVKNYDMLKRELEKVKNKAEYSVQIFCDRDSLAAMLSEKDQELNGLKEKMEKTSKGASYLLNRQFEIKMKDAIAVEISMLARDFSSEIGEYVEILKVEKKTSQVPDKYKDMKPIAAFSCLVHDEKVEILGEVLEGINRREGFAVRFTGPWAPFSFVELKDG